MAKCEICAKTVKFGNNDTFSHKRTNRTYKPNVRTVRVVENGTPRTAHVCSRCLRSGKVTRAI